MANLGPLLPGYVPTEPSFHACDSGGRDFPSRAEQALASFPGTGSIWDSSLATQEEA